MVYFFGDIHGKLKPVLKRINSGIIAPEDTLVLLGDVWLNFYCDYNEAYNKETLQNTGVNFLMIHGNVFLSVGTYDAVKDFNFLNQRVYERGSQFGDVGTFMNRREKFLKIGCFLLCGLYLGFGFEDELLYFTLFFLVIGDHRSIALFR